MAHYRRRRYRRGLGNRSRLFTIWSILGLLALLYHFGLTPKDIRDPNQWLQSIQTWLATSGLILAASIGLLALIFTAYLIFQRQKNSQPGGSGFKDRPWDYDREIIQLLGKVEYVFPLSLIHIIKTKLKDTIRRITKNQDPAGRYVHRRFLISSPLLKKGELLMVIHNTAWGKPALQRHTWISLQGVYLHDRGRKRTAFGTKLSHYGKLHYTHQPKGFLQVLDRKPQIAEDQKVITNISDPLKNSARVKHNSSRSNAA